MTNTIIITGKDVSCNGIDVSDEGGRGKSIGSCSASCNGRACIVMEMRWVLLARPMKKLRGGKAVSTVVQCMHDKHGLLE